MVHRPMNNQVIKFKSKHYFHGVYMFVGSLFVMISLMAILYEPIISIILLVLSIIVFTTVYKVRIDLNEKTCFDYIWFLGFKKGEKFTFDEVTRVNMYKNSVSQRLNSRGSSSTFHYTLYKGVIIFDNNRTVYVGESKDKDKMLDKLQGIAVKLHAEVKEAS